MSRLSLEEREPGEVEAAQAALRAVLDRLPLADLTTQGFGRRENMLELFHGPMGGLGRELSGLRHLHLCLSHLPVLRHQRI